MGELLCFCCRLLLDCLLIVFCFCEQRSNTEQTWFCHCFLFVCVLVCYVNACLLVPAFVCCCCLFVFPLILMCCYSVFAFPVNRQQTMRCFIYIYGCLYFVHYGYVCLFLLRLFVVFVACAFDFGVFALCVCFVCCLCCLFLLLACL